MVAESVLYGIQNLGLQLGRQDLGLLSASGPAVTARGVDVAAHAEELFFGRHEAPDSVGVR